MLRVMDVVLDTTKVQIFKQITTQLPREESADMLFQIPQRYRFSSKSQLIMSKPNMYTRCFRYHKGTDFQANHNLCACLLLQLLVVLDTTKVQIFKQITTRVLQRLVLPKLFQIPQRYRFSSKSQQEAAANVEEASCFRYHKGTDFQANHNWSFHILSIITVVLDTTKVQIFKQITTLCER